MKISIWDILTMLLIFGTLILGIFMINIYNDPGTLAFLRTPTLPGLVSIPTNTSTPFVMPSTWTPTPGGEVILQPSQTMPPTATGFVMATFTPRPTNTPTVNMQATLDSLRATVWAEQTATAAVQQTGTAAANQTATAQTPVTP
jgi:hypothetical protein